MTPVRPKEVFRNLKTDFQKWREISRQTQGVDLGVDWGVDLPTRSTGESTLVSTWGSTSLVEPR